MNQHVRRVLGEMALDLGNAPDWIDPEKKRKITQGTHPYAQNPAFPREKPARRTGPPFKQDANSPDPTQSYSELVTSHVYPEILKKVQHYTGQDPRRQHPQQLMMLMMQAMQQAVRAESRHRPQLQQAAVEVVLNLPEFRGAREAIEAGELRIEAELLDPSPLQRIMQQRIRGAEEEEEEGAPEEENAGAQMQVEPEEETDEERQELGLDVPDIRNEYDAEANKRRFVNLLIQGAAINKNYAYHEIADQLQAIDPNILTTYGKLMSIAELLYWMMPEDALNQAMGGGQGGAGMEEIEREDDGVYVIRARAMVFPVLIQEIVKGLYEFLSFNEDEPADIRKYASDKGDTLGGEQWDIMKGPGVWRHLNHLVNQANAGDLMSKIYRHLVLLPTGEFNEAMQEILKETPRGRRIIQQLADEIRAEEEGRQEESKARQLFRTISG